MDDSRPRVKRYGNDAILGAATRGAWLPPLAEYPGAQSEVYFVALSIEDEDRQSGAHHHLFYPHGEPNMRRLISMSIRCAR
jgi:hypothetical protein